MGSNAAQGWYLFTFIVGFTLAPAGFVAIGWLMGLIGLALMAAAAVGFHRIKESDARDMGSAERRPAGAMVGR